MNRRLRRGQIWPLLLFGVFGAILLAIGLWQGAGQYRVLTSWPPVKATVTQSRVTMKSPTSYSAEITLRYQSGGEERTATVTPGYETSLRETMTAKVKAFAPGSHHAVRVDPKNPGNVVLNADSTIEFFLLPMVLCLTGVIFLGVGAAPWLLERTVRPRPAAPSLETAERLPQLVGGTFGAVGVLILALALWMFTSTHARATWPQTPATVTRCRVINYSNSSSNNRPSRPNHALEIEFRYTVNGQTYTAPTVAASGSASRERVEALLPAFAPGTKHLVRYNPADPGAMTFEQEGYLWVWILGLMGAVFLGMGLLCLVVFRAERNAGP